MIILCRADEAIIRYLELVEQRTEIGRHFVCQCARSYLQIPRLLRHLQAMLVGPRLETDFPTAKALEPGKDIGGDRLVSMADMRLAIGIMNRGRQVKGLSHRPCP